MKLGVAYNVFDGEELLRKSGSASCGEMLSVKRSSSLWFYTIVHSQRHAGSQKK